MIHWCTIPREFTPLFVKLEFMTPLKYYFLTILFLCVPWVLAWAPWTSWANGDPDFETRKGRVLFVRGLMEFCEFVIAFNGMLVYFCYGWATSQQIRDWLSPAALVRACWAKRDVLAKWIRRKMKPKKHVRFNLEDEAAENEGL